MRNFCVPGLLLTLCLCITVTYTKTNADTNQGYFWREFRGAIPIDALGGGSDYNGTPIYIGQVFYNERLIPAKIYENDRLAYFSWGDEKSQAENVKILCTQEKPRMKWVPTTSAGIPNLTKKYLITGGYDPNFDTYIGRVHHDGETIVGKVKYSTEYLNQTGLLITKDGTTFHYKLFDVLTYDPDTPLFDVRFN